ncbi:MFS transporter [Thermomonospora cellulosilytica]|uniref:EmrB/QacA subfamily drug resistance transporter n=1 Tax=Thermomonospora cellulosilytica TaxID=1411118 RepID=A0A7W3N3R6_9ACTN|nr:MFS transporter [Thermomonospora cellulosilytica]MBA9006980.1 EmrB/QacA subfamily drug resistance transporter [Thermomonospora cellulosilytica]
MSAAATVTDSSPAADGALSRRRRHLALVVMSLGVSLIVVDATIVGVMLPRIVDGLGATTGQAEWITSIYPMVFAALLIPCGRAGDLAGRRRTFVLGTAVFVAASLLAAAAGDASVLIAARALQGVGASLVMPATLATVNAIFTGRQRAVAFGIWGSLIGGMAALGPLLGGALAASLGWRWAFGINLPLGLALIAGALALMPETRRPAERGVDVPGAVLATLGLGALVCGLIEGPYYGWWTPLRPFSFGPYDWPQGLSPVPVLLALAAALLVALAVVEKARGAAGRPVMLDPALLRIPSFRQGNAVAALISVGELGLLFVLPLFLAGVHGDDPLQISLAVLPLAVGAFLAGPFAGRLAGRAGPHRVVRLGLALEVGAVLGLGLTLGATTGGWGLAPWMLLYGVGLGLTSAQLTGVCLAEVPPARAGQASGIQSTSRQVGAALGIAIVGAVFATGLGREMTHRLAGTSLPPERQAAVVHEMRDSAGTYARDLDRAPGMRAAAQAADHALAAAARQAVLATAAILALGLAAGMRLRPGGPPVPEQSASMTTQKIEV